jgi:DNA-binding NarL/FixJ family response regulator
VNSGDLETSLDVAGGAFVTAAAQNDPAGTDLAAVLVEASRRIATLTARQFQVLECLGRGLSNRQISSLLAISEYTVKVHIGNTMTALGLDSRLQIGIVAHHHLTGCSCQFTGNE